MFLRIHGPDFLEESFETSGRNHTHEPSRRLTKVTVCMGDSARRENGCARFRRNSLPINHELVFTFENLKRLVFAMVNVWRRTAIRYIVRFNSAQGAAQAVMTQ